MSDNQSLDALRDQARGTGGTGTPSAGRAARPLTPARLIRSLALSALFTAGLLVLIRTLIAGSSVYQEAVAAAQADAEVIAALGEPVEAGWLIWGRMRSGNMARLQVAVSGPEGSGRLHLNARMVDGEWVYDELYVVVSETGERIDLND